MQSLKKHRNTQLFIQIRNQPVHLQQGQNRLFTCCFAGSSTFSTLFSIFISSFLILKLCLDICNVLNFINSIIKGITLAKGAQPHTYLSPKLLLHYEQILFVAYSEYISRRWYSNKFRSYRECRWSWFRNRSYKCDYLGHTKEPGYVQVA